MGGSRRWPTDWSIQKSTERRSLSTKWCTISHSKFSDRKPWSLYLVSTDMNLGKPHLSSPCPRAFPSFAWTGEVRPETQAALCCFLKVALLRASHRNGTPVLWHIGSLAHLTAGCDGMLADTGGFRLLCPQQLGVVKFDFGQLRGAQTTSKR